MVTKKDIAYVVIHSLHILITIGLAILAAKALLAEDTQQQQPSIGPNSTSPVEDATGVEAELRAIEAKVDTMENKMENKIEALQVVIVEYRAFRPCKACIEYRVP